MKDSKITVVAMTKIEASVLGSTPDNGQTRFLLPTSTIYSISDIFKEINTADKHFLKYLPDGFLTAQQKYAKSEAIKEDEIRKMQRKLHISA